MSFFIKAALIGAVSVCALPALAQENSARLPQIDVQGQVEGGSLTVPNVQRQREILNQNAGSVGFVDSESYKNTYANNLRDVLKEAPGVYVQERYSQELRLSVRGSGISRSFHTRGIEVLQDGIPTNTADGSGDFYQIDPLALRSVEIYKGGNGLIYGASTLGGAINFITPTAHTAVAPNIVRFDGGSFRTGRLSGQMSRVSGDADVLVNGTVTHSDGYRQHMRQQSEQINANLGYRINPFLETRFYVGIYLFDQLLPGSLTLTDALRRPKIASAAALSGDQARNTQTQRIANRTTLKLETGQIDFDSWFVHKNLYHPIFQVIDQDGYTYGIAPRYSGSFEINGFRNDVIAGFRIYGGNNDALQFANIGGQRGAQTLNSLQKAFNAEVYAENRFFFLPNVALMTGVKALHDERDYTDFGGLPASPAYKAASKTYEGVNPKLGLLWEPRKDIQVFADITRSLDVPDFSDLNQTIGATNRFVALQPQRAWTAEIGTRGRYERLSWDVTLYRAQLRDELLQYTTNPSFPAATFNAPRTVHQGVELGAGIELVRDVSGIGDTITFNQIWTYNDFKFRNDPQYADNRIAGIPQNVLRSTLTYRHPVGFYITPTLDWIPQGAFVDYANSLRVPSYALIGLQTGIDFSNGLSLFVDARNLADKRYISDFGTVTKATPATATFYPGNGRAIYAGLRYAW